MESPKPEQKHAVRIAKKYALTPPVNVKSILLNYADVVEEYLPGKVDAVCINNNSGRPLVIVDQFLPATRERFTLAHELGHIIIPWHYGMISCHTDRGDEYDERSYREMETEANNFAAELIMPSAWISEIISKEISNGLDGIIQSVTQKAQVSFSAAFFTVFKCLPKGFISYVENTSTGHGRFSESQGTSLFIPIRSDRSVAFEWLDTCSSDKNEYDLDTFTINWWRIDDNVSESRLNEILEQLELNDLSWAINEINKINKGSIASIFEKMVEKLPEGFILSFEDEYIQRRFLSANTPIPMPISELSGELDKEWLYREADSHGYCAVHNYTIYWWRFLPKKANPTRSIDQRNSKEIFREILEDTFTDTTEKKDCMYSMAGIVGALNNRNFDSFDSFYTQFKYRLTGEKKFEKIFDDPRLEDFVVNKINELLKKKKK